MQECRTLPIQLLHIYSCSMRSTYNAGKIFKEKQSTVCKGKTEKRTVWSVYLSENQDAFIGFVVCGYGEITGLVSRHDCEDSQPVLRVDQIGINRLNSRHFHMFSVFFHPALILQTKQKDSTYVNN